MTALTTLLADLARAPFVWVLDLYANHYGPRLDDDEGVEG